MEAIAKIEQQNMYVWSEIVRADVVGKKIARWVKLGVECTPRSNLSNDYIQIRVPDTDRKEHQQKEFLFSLDYGRLGFPNYECNKITFLSWAKTLLWLMKYLPRWFENVIQSNSLNAPLAHKNRSLSLNWIVCSFPNKQFKFCGGLSDCE